MLGVVVDSGETTVPSDQMEAARLQLQATLAMRPRIARHMAPAAAVGTFMRFRLDGTFDPDSDRRQGIAGLVHTLVAELPNEARLEMARLSGARDAQARIAQTLVKSITAISGALGAQPIPLADLPFLLTFQLAMVSGIIYISGREMSLKLATEFLGTMGINMGLGLAFREGTRAAVRAAAKLLLPGLGNAISGLVAAAAPTPSAARRPRTSSKASASPMRASCSNARSGPTRASSICSTAGRNSPPPGIADR